MNKVLHSGIHLKPNGLKDEHKAIADYLKRELPGYLKNYDSARVTDADKDFFDLYFIDALADIYALSQDAIRNHAEKRHESGNNPASATYVDRTTISRRIGTFNHLLRDFCKEKRISPPIQTFNHCAASSESAPKIHRVQFFLACSEMLEDDLHNNARSRTAKNIVPFEVAQQGGSDCLSAKHNSASDTVRSLQYFLYVSTQKLEMLSSQIPEICKMKKIARGIATGPTLVSREKLFASEMSVSFEEKLRHVESALLDQGLVGTTDDTREWITGTENMIQAIIEDQGFCYFTTRNRPDSTCIIALAGSADHIIGYNYKSRDFGPESSYLYRISKVIRKELNARNDDHSNQQSYLNELFDPDFLRAMQKIGEIWEREGQKGVFQYIDGLAGISNEKKEAIKSLFSTIEPSLVKTSDLEDSILRNVFDYTDVLCYRQYRNVVPHRVRFLAKVLIRGTIKQRDPHTHIQVILATPLYVSLAE